MAEQFLTVEQAAARLQVQPITVRRHLRRGIKRGNLWRVPESALGETATPTVSPLLHAVELIKARDAQEGPVPTRSNSSAQDVRAVREAQTP